jgi:thymidylate synthase
MSSYQMEIAYAELAKDLLAQEPFDRGEVHAQKVTRPEMVTRELRHVTQYFKVDSHASAWQETIKPNLPWAEDHFQERVSGEPLNPPPSNEWWPFAQAGNAEHKIDGKFSHTYPERFWPRHAAAVMDHRSDPNFGIRFEYGDLTDVIEILSRNLKSRQAYLPVWFPEDLTAAREGQRVPCTLGYHFLTTPDGFLDVTYIMRSCDFVRFYRDDIYMAGRLLQWVTEQVGQGLRTGELVLHIANLHCFVGDDSFLREKIKVMKSLDKRSNYDFGAML